ncbi:class I SAM-dependent methyltransferase [Neisseriaceae bacterium TC5R-5]|nr:class I SAM-dependent methyltransferase [Neisseriaceae bacterium TC5R-5]
MSEFIASRCICCHGSLLKKSPAVLMPFVAHRVFGWQPVEITAAWGMKNLRPGWAYSLCNSLQCQSCGVLFLDIRFSDNQMCRLYQGYRDSDYTTLRDFYEPGYADRNTVLQNKIAYLDEVEKLLHPYVGAAPTVLDWGGGNGCNTPFRQSAKTVYIHDISTVDLIDGCEEFDFAKPIQTRLDLIVCSNVLEHIPYPDDLLNKVIALMSLETILYIEIPYEDLMRENESVRDSYLQKKHWHEHINFFSIQSILTLTDRLGLLVHTYQLIPNCTGGKNSVALAIVCSKSS